jgi:hypothetical protein
MSDIATLDAFTPHVGSAFDVLLAEGQRLPLTLGAADVIPTKNANVPRPPFSLIFRPPPGYAFSQGTYRLHHATLGELELFLVPVQPDEQGLRLEAVFA